MDNIHDITKQYFRADLPPLQVGDKIEVTAKHFNQNEKSKDGKLKYRLTHFKGIVIAQKNPQQISYTFSVLKEGKGSDKVAIRSVFSFHSPLLKKIKKLGKIKKKVRRENLNNLKRKLTKKKENK